MKTTLFLLLIFSSSLVFSQKDDGKTRLKGWRKIYGKVKVYEYKRSLDEIESPYSVIQDSTKNKTYYNEMRMLHNGLGSLYARLDMIKRAQKTIEVEYFIFVPQELSSKLILRELMLKADQGVKVRILIDKSFTVFAFKKEYVAYIKKQLKYPQNFEVRYYNAAPNYKLSSIQFRDHRKLIVIDDREMLTGGRNIEDMYFDLNKEFNYLDRDIWVKGTIVPAVRESFDEYWEHKISQRIKKHTIKNKDYQRIAKELEITTDDEYYHQKILKYGRWNMETMPIRECPVTSYASDLPGAAFKERMDFKNYKEKYRIVERGFGERMRKSTKVHVSSPYFMLNTRSGKLMDDLAEKGVEMSLLTNSLGATDAVYVSSAFYRVVNDWADIGVTSYLHNSKIHENGNLLVFPEVRNARWGLHSKSHVYFYEDGTSGIMVGTYNIDNRSSFYDNEMAIFCDGSDELTQDLYNDIQERIQKTSYKVVGEELAEDFNGVRSREYFYGHAPEKKIRLMKRINIPVEIFQFLL